MTINWRGMMLAGALLAAGPSAFAQAYPAKPVMIVVPFSAGGPADVLTRALAKGLQAELGQPVLVENRTGAGGSVGIDSVVRAPADGYVIGMAHTGSTAINPHLYAKHPYDPRTALTPITPVVSYTNVLVVNASLPLKTVAELVAWSKQPNVAASFASGGNGATNHLSGEVLKSLTGAKLQHIPYKGNAPAMVDVMAGNVSAMFDIPSTAIPQIRSGKVRPIAVTSAKRSQYLPEVPTMSEAGVPGFDEAGSDLWFGLVGPANLPKPVVDRLYAATVKVMATTEMRDAIRAQAYEGWTLPPPEFAAFIRADYDKWGKVIKLAGARIE